VFTGIIRHQGQLAARESARLTIACPSLRPRITAGESIAVNGVCLTAARLTGDGFAADLLDETLALTTLGALAPGTRLNLEPPLSAGDTLGGHWVQGHVDGTAELLSAEPRAGGDHGLRFSLPQWLQPILVDRGSICIDGVSLTVQNIGENSFAVGIIPVTWNDTNLGNIHPGDRVNIEADYLVKTVRNALASLLPAMLADRGQGLSQAASH
jgi:riboflavin synthase